MATHRTGASFALRSEPDRSASDGAWWPEGRELAAQLPTLVAAWPANAGRIARVLYSPPDWDDRPRSVQVEDGRRIKTGSFPRDDTHLLTLTTLNGRRYAITVIAPDTAPDDAARLLSAYAPASADRP